MGCSGSKAQDPTKRERTRTFEDEDDGKTFIEKIKDIEIKEDPNECIADLRMLRKNRELKAKGFLRKVINKGNTPESSEDEQEADDKKKDSDDEHGDRSKADKSKGDSNKSDDEDSKSKEESEKSEDEKAKKKKK